MVHHSEIEVDEIYLIHNQNPVISGVFYSTTTKKVDLAERVLREEFNLVDELGFQGRVCPKIGLVCEREGTGIYHVHLVNEEPTRGPHLYFHYWIDRMEAKDFLDDPMRKPIKRIYDLIDPRQVTDMLGTPITLPWTQ